MEEIMNKAIQDIKEILENRNKNEELTKTIDQEIHAKVDKGFTYNNKMFAKDKESEEYKELASQKELNDNEIDKLEQKKKELTVEWGLAGVRNELSVKIKEEQEEISVLDEKIEEMRTRIHENDAIKNWNHFYEDTEFEEEDTKKMVEELKPLLEEKESREKGLKDIQDFANSIRVDNLDELSKVVMAKEEKSQTMKKIHEGMFARKEKGFEDLLPKSYLDFKNDLFELVDKDLEKYYKFVNAISNMSLQELLVKMSDTAQKLGRQERVNDLTEALKKIDERTNEADKAEPAKKETAKTEPVKKEPAKKELAKTEPAKKEPAKKEPAKTEPEKKEPVKTEPEKKEPAKTEPVKKESEKKEPAKTEPEKKSYDATRIVVEPTFDSITIFIKGEKEPHVVNNMKELMKDGKTLKKHRIFSKTPLYALGIKKSDPAILKALESIGRDDLKNDYINSFVEPKDTIDGIQYLFDNAGKMNKKMMRQVKKYAKYAEGYGVAEVTGLKKGRIDKVKDWFYARKRIKLASEFEKTQMETEQTTAQTQKKTPRDNLNMEKVDISHKQAIERVQGEVVKETPKEKIEKRGRKQKGMSR